MSHPAIRPDCRYSISGKWCVSGAPGEVFAWRENWMERARTIFELIGLDAAIAPASDPFFGHKGKLLANNQRDQGLKFEALIPLASSERTAVASFNLHHEHFGSAFGIQRQDGSVAHSACVGFGLERITLALFRTHGMDVRDWPGNVRRQLGLKLSRHRVMYSQMMLSLFSLDPATYVPSALHGPQRTFRETNCYVDLWIELLNARGIVSESAMGFACTVDFEGDQWTFFKPPPEDLLQLYGIDVHEMQLYRPTVAHVIEQLKAGRAMTLEADAFYLPDTAATAYRRQHVKSSIAVEGIDAAGQRLRYFHGAGYHELGGADYCGVASHGLACFGRRPAALCGTGESRRRPAPRGRTSALRGAGIVTQANGVQARPQPMVGFRRTIERRYAGIARGVRRLLSRICLRHYPAIRSGL